MCIERWEVPKIRSMYGAVILVMQYAVPLCIIAFCYIAIGVSLRKRAATMKNNRSVIGQQVRSLDILLSMIVFAQNEHLAH